MTVGVLVALLGAVGAGASPSIRDQRARAQAVFDQVQQLDGEVGDAAERFDGANYRLGLVRGELSAARADLVRATQRVRTSQAKRDLQVGDPVFFRGLGHTGMYIGGDNFIHAPRTGDVVKISSLSESYYTANWVGARRVL